jgi:serine/threonine protein kinase
MAYIHIEHERGAERQRVELKEMLTGQDGKKFKIEKMILGGEGGNGLVFEALQQGPIGVRCAVKVLRRVDVQRVDRFNNEVKVLQALRHEHITAHYGNGTIRSLLGIDVPWVAIDLGGPNLGLHVSKNGPVDAGLLGRIGLQMCSAMRHVHANGMIHRDLKPANFVWTNSAASERVFMIDFGLAKRVGEDTTGRPFDQFTLQHEFVGPAHYSSHELLAYGRDKTIKVDHRSDLFQLGRVLWFLATGVPSTGIPSKKLDPTKGLLHELVTNLSHDDPDDRLDDMAEIERVLGEMAAGGKRS